MSLMFRAPFYYGVLVQAEKEIDLREVYDFIPMVSEDEYGAVQAILQESPQRYVGKRKKERAIFYWLFLNCTIDEQNKATFLWKEPYATILNGQSIRGAPD